MAWEARWGGVAVGETGGVPRRIRHPDEAHADLPAPSISILIRAQVALSSRPMVAAWCLALVLLQTPTPPTEAARAAVDAAVLAHGAESREVARALQALARAQLAAGDAPGALEVRQRELQLRERLTGRPRDALESLLCRLEVGVTLRACERLDEALVVLAEAGSMIDALDPSVLTRAQRSNLKMGYLASHAQVLLLKGDSLAARPLLEDALAAAIAGLGDGNLNTQVVRQSLAAAMAVTGQLERARELAATALAHTEATCGPDDPRTGHALHVLGSLLAMAGRTEEATPLLERALRIRRAGFGPDHPDALAVTQALAQMHVVRHDYAAARAIYAPALERAQAALGADASMAVALERELAEVEVELGAPERAMPLAEHCLAVRAAQLPPGHMSVIHARLTLAFALGAAGRTADAVAELERALAADDGSDPDLSGHIRTRLAVLLPQVGREADALVQARVVLRAFPALLATWLPALLDLERVRFVGSRRQALDQILSWSRTDAEVAEAHADAIAWKTQVARGLFAQRAWLRRNMDAATGARLDELQGVLVALGAARQRGDAEAQARLCRSRRDLEQGLPGHDVQVEERPGIDGTLGPRDALLDFYVYDKRERGAHLLAFVVTGARSQPTRVDLGPLEPITAALRAHLQLAARRTQAPLAASRAAVDAVAARVHEVLWRPLAPSVREVDRLFVCPDGPLALVPFATLPGDVPGSFLIERFELCSLVSPRDLSRVPPAGSVGKKVVLVGDVDFGAEGQPRRFAALPGTGVEIDALATELRVLDFSVEILRGRDATPQALARLVADARFVHLATHGVFEAAAQDAALPGQRGGLALAGADAHGLFTTDEVAWLDLACTDLVVLSACDSGNGEPTVGEHVLGLRRALRLAGASRTVTSAWRVDDAATAHLMRAFYARLTDGAEPAAALRLAQLAVLAANRKRCGDGLPGTWGAFLVEGR